MDVKPLIMLEKLESMVCGVDKGLDFIWRAAYMVVKLPPTWS